MGAASETIGREVFLGFPPWMKVLFYIAAFGSTAVMLAGFYLRYRKYARGRKEKRTDHLWQRLLAASRGVGASVTIGRGDRFAGIAHWLVFWGFVVFLISTALVALDEDIVGIFAPQYRFLHSGFYLGFKFTNNLFAVLCAAGLIAFAWRRRFGLVQLNYDRVDRPKEAYDRGNFRRADRMFLSIVFAIVLTGILIESFRIAIDFPPFEVWAFGGWAFAKLWGALGITAEAAKVWHRYIWWIHVVIVFIFFGLIPWSKGLHMFTSFFALLFRDDLAGRRLAPVPESAAVQGYRQVTDFTWKQLLDLDACTKCGRCHAVCPARGQGAPLSPRDLILDLREWADRQAGLPVWAPQQSLLPMAGGSETAAAEFSLVGGVISADTLWACTTCRACVEICPVGIEHVPMIVEMRRTLVDAGEMDGNLQNTLQKLGRQGNSFGQSDRLRARWTQGLPFKIKDARKEPVEFLWFVGDYASYDPRLQEITRGVARVLTAAGVDFGILYEGERNSGNDVRRVGEEGLFDVLAEHNIEQMARCDFQRIITTDPHSYNALRYEYPAKGGLYQVSHYTEVLQELLESGRLRIPQPLGVRVTYHDPCYLGRYNGVFDAPRAVLQALGCQVHEMPRCRENSYCCGAGGGRIWMGDDLYPGEKPAESRIREALALGDAAYFVVACPKDVAMYSDAVKTTGSEGRIEVVDIIQLVERTLAAAPAVVN